jgi:hypothetical protein
MPRNQVFISYSHKDTRWRNDLEIQLKPYLREGSITSWSDEQIVGGSQWFGEIKSALAQTKVAVLLVTPDFLASDFIYEHELGPFLKEAEQGGVKILWVPVRDSAYKRTPLKNYQAVLSPDTPLAAMTKAKRDKAWVRICGEIEKAVTEVTESKKLEAPPDPAFTGRDAEIPKPLNTGRARPAMGGDGISHVRGTAPGTLGCLVCDRKEPQRVYVLSDFNGLCHPTDESFEGDAIVQPGRADGGTRAKDLVAMLTRWTRVRDVASAADSNVSAAIAEVRRLEEFSAEIRGRGLLKGVRPAVEGMEVWVVARSGQASGKVIQIGAKQKVPVSYRLIEGGLQSTEEVAGFHPILFGDLIVCTTMLQPGDCGAILVDRENYAVGLGFAEGEGESYFFPIQRVLDALGVELMTEWPPV